jgi:hypothetical protein
MQVPGTEFNWIFNLIFIVMFLFIYLYGRRFESYIWTKQAEAELAQLEALSNQGRAIARQTIKELGFKQQEIKPILNRFLEYFVIEPVDRDPTGVIGRIDHLLTVRQDEYEEEMAQLAKFAPYATEEELANAESVLSGVMALNYVYRVVRHFLLLGKKTKSIYFIMQLQMQLPMILQMAKAYFEAVRAFSDGMPIGDGIGPLIIAQLADEIGATPPESILSRTIAQEGELEGRILHLIRAKGPASFVGHPGKAVETLVELEKGNVAMVITVSAGITIKKEEHGTIIRGVGAAIGDAGPEKIAAEESCQKYNIPLYAIIIKETEDEVLAPMNLSLVKAVPRAIQQIEARILSRSKKGDVIIIAGIGNSVGIA